MAEVFAYLLGLFIIVFAIGWLLVTAAKDIYNLFVQTYFDDGESHARP